MEILFAAVSAAAVKIVEYLVEPIGRQAGYLICYNRNMSALRTEVQELGHIRSSVQVRVDEATRNGQLIRDDVNGWLIQVNQIDGEVGRFFENEVQVNERCLGGWCRDPISRYSLSSRAKDKKRVVIELKGRGAFGTVSHHAPPSRIEYVAIQGFVDFGSRKLIIEGIMAALKDDNINVIGISGLGGVGKTMVVKEVARRAKVENLFEDIVMAVVSQTPDVKKIQDEIAEMLGLKLEDDQSLYGRAARLRARLLCTRVLVILDDVWKRLDLESFGIPFGGDCKDCKVMLTSRSQDVLHVMATHENFTIGPLSENEPWDLFKQMAGDSIESDPVLYQVAKEVLQECCGLPIAIVTVGSALRGQDTVVWRDALEQLRGPSSENISALSEHLYHSLELSYSFLKPQQKSFLLLCCLFEEDANIEVEDLVKYGMGLALFQDNIDALTEARERVHTLIDHLKSCCLLLNGDDEDSVKVHDVIRDGIRSIAAGGKEFFTIGGGWELNALPTKGLDQQYSFASLSDRFDCSKLQLLLLTCINRSLEAPDNLFEEMKELKVLNLRWGTLIPSPPPSLSFLTKLRTLCLHCCKSENISAIGELKTLIILSFRNSSINELPPEIGMLTRLQLLDLTGCESLTIIAPGVISSLNQLVELYLRNCGLQWVVEEEEECKGKNEVKLAELVSLRKLITLETHLPTAKFPHSGILFENLERFWISIRAGTDIYWWHQSKMRNELRLNLDARIPVDGEINVLLKKTEILGLQLTGVKNVLNDQTQVSLAQLKSLTLSHCEGPEYLIDTVDLDAHSVFPVLETLDITYVQNLKMICDGQLPEGSFGKLRSLNLYNLSELMHLWKGPTHLVSLGNLRRIEVKYCDRLENLFSHSIVRGLEQLEVLNIESCETMKEIVAKERGEYGEAWTNKVEFPKLSELRIAELPSISSFCKKMDEIEFPQLSTLYLKDLPELWSFHPDDLALEGNRDTATQHLFNAKVKSLCELRSMKVYSCNKLMNVFSSHLIQSLQNLEDLKVHNCDLLEVVFDFEGMDIEEGHAALALTCLKNLILSSLPKLTHLWKKAPLKIKGFQNLRSVEICCCQSLKHIFTPSIAKQLVKLEKLCIRDCAVMEIVGKDQEDEEENEATKVILFPQLDQLCLENLPDLMSFGPEPYTFEFIVLKKLSLNNANMKVFVRAFLDAQKQRTINARSHEEVHEQQIKFPSLEVLELGGEDNVERIMDGLLPAGSIYKLKEIRLLECNKLLAVPSNLVPRLEKLKGLTIRDCAKLVEVFEVEGLNVEEIHTVLLSELKHLFLENLPGLKHILKGEPKGILFFQRVSVLRVQNCNSLRNLFSPSTAKIAEQLEELEIIECETMTEIVADDKGEGDEKAMDKIEFPQLRHLTLAGLPSLVSFFPTANTKASDFRRTEKLKEIDEGYGEILSKVNLHTHIQHVFNEKVAFPSLEELELSGMNLNEIWCKKDDKETMGFQNLKSLKVEGCGNLRNLLYPSMAKGVVHLEKLVIADCEMMEEIVVKGENKEEERMNKITIPRLKYLGLSCLRNLTSFCQGFYAFELPLLEDVIVDDCPKMETFSFGSLSTPMLEGVNEGLCQRKMLWMGDLNNTIQQLFAKKELEVNQEIRQPEHFDDDGDDNEDVNVDDNDDDYDDYSEI